MFPKRPDTLEVLASERVPSLTSPSGEPREGWLMVILHPVGPSTVRSCPTAVLGLTNPRSRGDGYAKKDPQTAIVP